MFSPSQATSCAASTSATAASAQTNPSTSRASIINTGGYNVELTQLMLEGKENELLNSLKELQKANKNQVKKVQKVLNRKNPEGMTLLMLCAYTDFRDGLKRLLDLGVTPEIKDTQQNSFLHYFISKGQHIQLEIALEHFSKHPEQYNLDELRGLFYEPNASNKTPLDLIRSKTPQAGLETFKKVIALIQLKI